MNFPGFAAPGPMRDGRDPGPPEHDSGSPEPEDSALTARISRRKKYSLLEPSRSARLNRPDHPPYSFANELRLFLLEGVPLFVFYILKQGVPPFFTMVVAGHTPDSATLQASLGFGRTFYNAVTWMPLKALTSYYENVVPVAIGARRDDRLPMYLRRSVLLVAIFIMPSMVLQMFADSILLTLGVPAVNAEGVGEYCRLMVATAWLTLLDNHFEVLFCRLGFVKMANLNALLSGLGVECVGTYIIVYRLNLGIRGCAYVQILARLVRVLLWLSLMLACNLTRTIFMLPKNVHATEKLLTRTELRIFMGQGLPNYLTTLTGGWVIADCVPHYLTTLTGGWVIADCIPHYLTTLTGGWVIVDCVPHEAGSSSSCCSMAFDGISECTLSA